MYHNPDTWVIVKITQPDQPDLYKLLVTFYGGYLNGDEWRVSSRINKVTSKGKYYIFNNESGSEYKCLKTNERLSSLTTSIFNLYKKNLKQDVSIIEMKEYLKIDKPKKKVTKRKRA